VLSYDGEASVSMLESDKEYDAEEEDGEEEVSVSSDIGEYSKCLAAI
jgi:hypothetical protein